MRILEVEVDGNIVTPVATGFDRLQIKSVIDNGVGSYTIILKKPFKKVNANKAKAMITMLESNRAAYLSASDHDRVTVQVTDLAGVDAEGAFSILIMGTDSRINY